MEGIELCLNCRAVKLDGYAWRGACGCRFFGAESATVAFITKRAVGFQPGLKIVWSDRGGRTTDRETRREGRNRLRKAVKEGFDSLVARWDGDEQLRTRKAGTGLGPS